MTTAWMRALLVDGPGRASLVEIERPRPAPDEVLVEVTAAGICGSDVDLLEGTRPANLVRYPIVPGHEWAGRIVAVGAAVSDLRPGMAVVAEGFRACGRCDRCLEGRTNLCAGDYAETGFTHAGGFAEYLVVPARLVHALPAGADLSAAALLEPAACVAEGLLAVNLRPGMRIAVVGSGTIGLLAVAMLARTSPERLVLVGTRSTRLARGRDIGADEVFSTSDGEAAHQLGSDFDLVFEGATTPSAVPTALSLTRRGGSVVLVGLHGRAQPNLDSDTMVLRHLRVQGVFGASGMAWRWVVKLFATGQLEPSRLISHSFALDEHVAAFAALRDRSGDALKVQLMP